ncbi:hypothetical protein [Vibrio maritimus]|uniref:hypothetical protein n=1 Tax=Vibrio maritimus TaxID=990268 RepID=UPI004068EB9C
MKALLILCVALLSFAAHATTPWQKSPALSQLLDELQTYYQSSNLRPIEKRYMRRVDNISYFAYYIDKPDTPEYAQLEGYLIGLQTAYGSSVYQQIKTNATPWFCPKQNDALRVRFNDDKPALMMENLVYEVLEKELKKHPNAFRHDSEHGSPITPLNSIIMFGLQTQYPCYNPIPERHRFNGWKDSY